MSQLCNKGSSGLQSSNLRLVGYAEGHRGQRRPQCRCVFREGILALVKSSTSIAQVIEAGGRETTSTTLTQVERWLSAMRTEGMGQERPPVPTRSSHRR